jgi:hypothetical protein
LHQDIKLHRSLLWSLRSYDVRGLLKHGEGTPSSSFQRQWSLGPSSSHWVATSRFYITALVEEIELWLKTRIELELRSIAGSAWWNRLPDTIRGLASQRYKIACADFGRHRAGSPRSVSWLSFGDVIKLLDSFDSESWRSCLQTGTAQRRAVSRAFKRIKSFRDNRLAHVRFKGPTLTEVKRLTNTVDTLARILRPRDYSRSAAIQKLLLHTNENVRRVLLQTYEARSMQPRHKRIKVLRTTLAASLDSEIDQVELAWYDSFILCCVEAGGGTISPFLGGA